MSAFGNHPARQDVQIQNRLSNLLPPSNAFETAKTSDWNGEEKGIDDDAEDMITIGLFLKPGDVVELTHPDREAILAVFVKQVGALSQFLTAGGMWRHSHLREITFAIPGSIDPSLLQPLIPFLPTSPALADPKGEIHVPPSHAAPIRLALEQMVKEAETVYRTNATVLDRAYKILADPVRSRMMTLTQIAKKLLGTTDPSWTPKAATLLAVRKALHHNEFRFLSDHRNQRLTNVFVIRAMDDVHMVETVHGWIRDYHEHLAVSANSANSSQGHPPQPSIGASYVAEFIKKSRRLIAISRSAREPNQGGLGPSKTHANPRDNSSLIKSAFGETFTSNDKQIVKFLRAWTLETQFKNMPGLRSASISLVYATNCYGPGVIQNTGIRRDDSGGTSTGMLFLQEIGVLNPYENPTIYHEHLMLPPVHTSRNLELLHKKSDLIRRRPDFQDAMSDLRRDWGSTTVFCIDDVDAHEIDDGISIERIDGQTKEFWIHVHVANPTAFFDKTHTVAALAAHMTQTVYTPERAYPMMPAWVTQGYFSLDSNRPVLTFSSRINSSGDVLETKIQHGIIRNIVSLSPSELADTLGMSDQTAIVTQRLVVGGEVPKIKTQRSRANVTPSQLQDLQDLYIAAKSVWGNRKGLAMIDMTALKVRVFENTRQAGIAWNPPSTERARWTEGDPIIEVTSTAPRDMVQIEFSPRDIVAEMMMLACTTAGAWCGERHIPAMFRGTVEAPDSDTATFIQLQEQLEGYRQRKQQPPRQIMLRHRAARDRAIVHFAPTPHTSIGVTSYIRVTSPLRRFSDMIAHWQIEAAIRYEAQSGKKFNAHDSVNAPRDVLPFSQGQVQDSIITLAPREVLIRAVSTQSTQHWAKLALMRAYWYHEAVVPKVFRFWVTTEPTSSFGSHSTYKGVLIDFGIRAVLLEELDTDVGDEWEVELDNVNIFLGTLFVRPIRLVSRGTAEGTNFSTDDTTATS